MTATHFDGPLFVGGIEMTPGGGGGVSVKESTFGAIGDGITNDSVGIQAAIDAVSADGGGVVFFPPGTYLCCNICLRTNVYLQGAGIDATTLKRTGVGDVLISDGFAALTGTSGTGGIHDFGISDLTIHGDFDNDTSVKTTLNGSHNSSITTLTVASTTGFPATGTLIVTNPTTTDGLSEAVTYTGTTPTTFTGVTRQVEQTVAQAHSSADIVQLRTSGYGIRIYGYSYNLNNIVILRCRQDGLYSEWAPVATGLPSPNSMDAVVSNVKIQRNQGHGVTWAGPHDTKFHKLVVWQNHLIGIRMIANGAAENFVNCHSYGKQVHSWWLGSGGQLTNCIGEQGTNAQFRLAQNETQLVNCWAFGTAGLPVKGYVIGDSTNTVSYSRINGYSRNCESGAIDFTGDGGHNVVDVSIFQSTGTGNDFVGTASTSTMLRCVQGGSGTLNGPNWQFPNMVGLLDVQAKAVASGAETVARFTTTDGNHGYMEFQNAHAVNATFTPRIVGVANSLTLESLNLTAGTYLSSEDTGTQALMVFNSRAGGGSSAAVTAVTRPLFSWCNNDAVLMQMNPTGSIINFKAVATKGFGLPAIYGSAKNTAVTNTGAATTSTYTVGAADGTFQVSANVLVTTATSHAFTVICSYTDEGATSRTLTMSFTLVAGGTLVTSIANGNGAVPYMGIPQLIRCQAGTTITIGTTGTFTTVVYNVEGLIVQVA